MRPRLTLFMATLVQDSALSVSGLDRESSSDQPFALVNGVPTLVGRGIKGAAVAMAKRFFDPLPRSVSDDIQDGALRRSAWEFANATAQGSLHVRSGVGICHKTNARADGVLYDREVIPEGTRWNITLRVDWSHVVSDDEGQEAEGILGYVLAQHWAKGRCWLGGGAARGLGWCHLENLKVFRFNKESYNHWVQSGRMQLPTALATVPTVEPTRSWCFRTIDIELSFGEYKPDQNESAWGLDMLAIGPHDTERVVQPTGDGMWAKPAWVNNDKQPYILNTNRAILMEGARPLLPGASVRGPLRHAFSRAERVVGHKVQDPHTERDNIGIDVAGQLFGTVSQSSGILIRDARAEKGWAAAKLHMHAEDEFSAGSYGSAKRDAVRLLAGVFPVRIVIEGATAEKIEPLISCIDRQIALGRLGHLPVGGHKTRGAGWGRWQAQPWVNDDVIATRSWTLLKHSTTHTDPTLGHMAFIERPKDTEVWVRTKPGVLGGSLTLGEAAKIARDALGAHVLIAWWCEPTINLYLSKPPVTYGQTWPVNDCSLQVDEVAFYTAQAVWRAVHTSSGVRFLLIEEVLSDEGAVCVSVVHTPASLHGFQRFSSMKTGKGAVILREWRNGDEMIGFTIMEVH